jgi:TRAP-type C4-dicarboxylate transport system permease small subunit
MDQKEQKRKRALIVLQIVIYGYLLIMFGIQLYMSFARARSTSTRMPRNHAKRSDGRTSG